jgi:antirestriction protein ArdC
MLQRPDATRVAGYKTWQSLGRQVRKGERGITILAPCKYRRTEVDAETGEEMVYAGIRGFTTAKVFDLSQTDGEDLPEVRPTLLDGEGPEGLWDLLADQVRGAGFTLERGDCSGANRRTDPIVRSVRVRDDVGSAQAAKTLAHELAHIMLGHTDNTIGYVACRGRCEVEAESVAFLVCQAVGLPTDDYTFAYVAGWSSGDTQVVRDTADRVISASRAILAALGTELEAVA